MRAGVEVWRYCEASARFVFGEKLGDRAADEILSALRAKPVGMTRNDLREYFGRHKSSDEIGRALGVLLGNRLARMESIKTEGRPAERWFAAAAHWCCSD